jgi:small multidrug resistance pump
MRGSKQKRAFMHWIYLLAAIAAEVVATSALKASESFTRLGPSLVVVVGYAAAFYLLSLTFRTMPVGVVYAIWSGVGIVLISLVGWIVFRQTLDAAAVTGIALILAGVAVINLLSKSVPH